MSSGANGLLRVEAEERLLLEVAVNSKRRFRPRSPRRHWQRTGRRILPFRADEAPHERNLVHLAVCASLLKSFTQTIHDTGEVRWPHLRALIAQLSKKFGSEHASLRALGSRLAV